MQRMTSDPTLSRLRKRPLEADAATSARAAGEIDIAGCATIAYSSENPAHPVEHMLDGRRGPGATRWISARPDTVEHTHLRFAIVPNKSGSGTATLTALRLFA